jgi:nicotinamidase-related amidase
VDRFQGLDIPESLADAMDPSRLALVVYDMQVGVLSQIADGDRVVANVARVLDAARSRRVRTVFMRHYMLPAELAGASQLRQAKTWQGAARAADTRPLIPHGSPGFQLAPELQPRADEAVLDKITMSAFAGTPLDLILRDCGTTAYLIAGVALEVGIEPTVRHSTDLGYIPVVVHDACGAGNAEAATRSLESLAFTGDAILTTTDEVCTTLAAAPPRPA